MKQIWHGHMMEYQVNTENLDYNLFSKLIKRTGQKLQSDSDQNNTHHKYITQYYVQRKF